MLNLNEHSGLVSALGGLVILVLVGVGLSLVVDTQLHTSTNTVAVRRDILDQRELIRELNLELEKQNYIYTNKKHFSPQEAQTYQSVLSSMDMNAEKLALLESNRSDLEAGVSIIESEFEDYRKSYRDLQARKAIGEKYKQIIARNGRVFDDVTIRRVTPIGLEVRHKSGIARIDAPDLDAEWQDRFQWTDEERREQLERERLAQVQVSIKRTAPTSDSKRRQASALRRLDPEERDKIRDALNRNVDKWNSILADLRAELSDAEFASQGHASVPGSLETWKARKIKISRRIDIATQELHAAKEKLTQMQY